MPVKSSAFSLDKYAKDTCFQVCRIIIQDILPICKYFFKKITVFFPLFPAFCCHSTQKTGASARVE
jgi:hypothetical protein